MLNLTLFTGYQFDSQEKVTQLFEFLNEVGGVFTPTRFDTKEPVRRVYQPNDLKEPVKLLSGYPKHLGGGLFLRGSKYKYLSLFRWSESNVSDWYIDLSSQFFNRSDRVEEFIQFIIELCKKFPIIYGGAAPKEDWNTKHLFIKHYLDGGESHEMVGINLERCLPGIYWCTIFGESLVKHFGRKKIESLPAYRIINLSNGGIIAILREMPFTPQQSERVRHDIEIIEILGNQYFFDINNLEKVCNPIQDVIQGASSLQKEPSMYEPSPEKDIEDFENQIVLTTEKTPYTDLEDLAEVLIVYLHTDVEEVSDCSRESLERLDEYFSKHPQKLEYKHDHLYKEFIPALGAYLGQVLVIELGAEWIVREPLLKSTIKINDKEISTFRAAYKNVYGNVRLLDIYDSLG